MNPGERPPLLVAGLMHLPGMALDAVFRIPECVAVGDMRRRMTAAPTLRQGERHEQRSNGNREPLSRDRDERTGGHRPGNGRPGDTHERQPERLASRYLLGLIRAVHRVAAPATETESIMSIDIIIAFVGEPVAIAAALPVILAAGLLLAAGLYTFIVSR